jgi:hypothetical protein
MEEELKPFHKEYFQKNFHHISSDAWFVKRVQRQQSGYAIIAFPFEERILIVESSKKAIERCKKEGMNHL